MTKVSKMQYYLRAELELRHSDLILDMLYKKNLEKLDNGKNVRVVFTLTRQKWDGLCSRIDAKCIKNVCGKDFANKIYFICGTGEFVKAMIAILQELNVAKENIKVENFGG